MSLSLADTRAAWANAQDLGADGRVDDVPGGWIRSIGAADPYLALRERVPGFRATQLGDALRADRVWVVPGVRGCIWLVPAADVPLCLRVSELSDRARVVRDLAKAGTSVEEVEELGAGVMEALSAEGLTTTDLRKALPDGAVRSLGEAGKKVGITSTLPPALRQLEWQGRIRRRHVDASLLHERYTWEQTGGLDVFALGPDPGDDPAAQALALAAHFLRVAGPATLDDFVAWSKLGKRVATAALEQASTDAIALDGLGSAWVAAAPRTAPTGLRLLPGLDNLVTLRGRAADLADAAHHGILLPNMGRKLAPIGKVSWLQVKPIVSDGAWIGAWEWDPDPGEVAWAAFGAWDAATTRAFHAAREQVEAFVREELGGDCSSSGIDSPARMAERAAHLRSLA